VRVTDFMPLGDSGSSLVRRITGVEGSVEMRQELRIRPGYSTVLPWMSRVRDQEPTAAPVLLAMAGPDALALRGLIFRTPTRTGTRENSWFRGASSLISN
jgi:hypothetical protein